MGRPFKSGDEVRLTRAAAREYGVDARKATAKIVAGGQPVVLDNKLGGMYSHLAQDLDLVRKADK